MTKYTHIVFMDGDEGREATDALYNVEGVVAHGVTVESIRDMIAHLSQWETGDEPEPADTPSWGSRDDVFENEVAGYILSANLGLGYVALTRVG